MSLFSLLQPQDETQEKEKSQTNTKLNKLQVVSNDELYTQYKDIEEELQEYWDDFKGKSICCPCDKVGVSNFYFYFKNNFDKIQPKEVIFSHLEDSILYNTVTILDKNGERQEKISGSKQGMFSPYFRPYLQRCDIVVTNPPFSLLTNIFKLVYEDLGKDFILLGTPLVLQYSTFKESVEQYKVFVGKHIGDMYFHSQTNIDKLYRVGNIIWITTFDKKFKRSGITYTEYTQEEIDKLPRLDDMDNVINLNNYKEYPKDYYGVVALPITAFLRINRDIEHEILSIKDYKGVPPRIKGKELFARIFVRKIKKE